MIFSRSMHIVAFIYLTRWRCFCAEIGVSWMDHNLPCTCSGHEEDSLGRQEWD